MIKTFPFRLDIEKEYNNRMYSVNSNDLKTVKFTFVVTDNGIPIDLTGLTVRIAIRKPDKKAVWQDCTVTNAPKGEVEVILESQAYIKKGEHEAELMLYKGSDTVAITQKFHYRAAEGIMSDKSLKSETVLGPIDQKLAEVEGTLEDLRKNGTGIDAQARSDIQSVTAALAEMPKKVNGKTPDEDGNIQIDIPQVDTSQLATKTELNDKADRTDVKPIHTLARMPTNTDGIQTNDIVLVYENILKWDVSFWESGSLTGTTGQPTETSTRIRTKDYIAVEPNTRYKVFDASPVGASGTITVIQYDATNTFVSTTSWQRDGYVFTTSPTTTKIKVIMQRANSTDITPDVPATTSKPVITRLY